MYCIYLNFGIELKDFPFSLIKPNGKYYYFYWMLSNLDNVENFDKEYLEAF
jgi:hypothetical protein